MALKSKKKHQKSAMEGVRNRWRWPDLPPELVYLIGKQRTVVQSIGTRAGVAKSWKVISHSCNPIGKSRWPQLECRDWHAEPETQGNVTIPNCRINRRNCSLWFPNGFRMACGPVPPKYEIHPISRTGLGEFYPLDETFSIRYGAMSESIIGFSKRIVMVLDSIHSPAFTLFSLTARVEWIPLDTSMADTFGSGQAGAMKFSNAIGYQEKIYAMSVQGSLVVIEETGDDSKLTITGLSRKRAVPSVYFKHFKEYLIECGGKILLVLLISRKKLNIVDDVEVFGLHLPRLSWVKIERLGDSRTLFLGADCSFSVDASKVGCKGNSVYFSHSTNEWWLYDLKSGGISKCIEPVIP